MRVVGSHILGLFAATLLFLGPGSSGAFAQSAPQPTVDADGTIHGAMAAAPVSSFLSPESKRALTEKLREPPHAFMSEGLPAERERVEKAAKGALDVWLKIYPSTIEETKIDGVRVFIVAPKDGIDPKNKNRVLIAAHQGGFITGGTYSVQVEAVPVAGRGRIKVIAVDYRMGPEHKYPAATEDMEAVYRHVLKTTKPANIGLYGCSAGGTLVAQSLARFQAKKLPTPGAASIQCTGAMESFWFGGDADTTTPFMNAQAGTPRPPSSTGRSGRFSDMYFEGSDPKDPLVSPGNYPAVLAKFPPTQIVTGTRDMVMSNALITHTELLKAGVDAQLFVQEGLGHGHFYLFAGTPESLTAYDVIWKFFDKHLKR